MKKIIVIGAGAWGTAIANLLAKNSNQVFLSANNKEVIDEINHKKTNHKFLPNIKLDKNLVAISEFEKEISILLNKLPILKISQFYRVQTLQLKLQTQFPQSLQSRQKIKN